MIKHTHYMLTVLENVDAAVLALKSVVVDVLGADVLIRFEICLAEALVNLVKYAASDATDAVVQIDLREANERVRVDIYDPEGTPVFDVRAHAKDLSKIELMAESGRGLGIIMQCADDVSYGAVGGRNRLALDFLKEAV
ncbi:MAG: ATP-binding protein [Paracoccaceae bacterium]|nr:ATP-binding protein [Paracoccaceae bacterium]